MASVFSGKGIYIRFRTIQKWVMCFYLIVMIAFAETKGMERVTQLGLYLFLGISLLSVLISKTFRMTRFYISLLVFGAVLVFGVLYSANTNATSVLYRYFVLLCIAYCISSYLQTIDDAVLLFKIFLYGGVILNISIVMHYGSDFLAYISQTGIRIGEVAGNENDIGMRSCFSAMIALFFALNEPKISKTKRVWYVFLAAFCATFSLLTGSKKVLIQVFAGVAFLLLFRRQKKINFISFFRTLLITAAVVLLLYYVMNRTAIFQTIIHRFEVWLSTFYDVESGSRSDRLRISFIQKSWAVFLQHPLFGTGTSASYTYLNTYTHCNYMEVLANHGLVGFAIFYYEYFIMLFQGAKCLIAYIKKPSVYSFDILAISVFLMIAVLSVAFVYYTLIYYQVLLLLCAFCLSKAGKSELRSGIGKNELSNTV